MILNKKNYLERSKSIVKIDIIPDFPSATGILLKEKSVAFVVALPITNLRNSAADRVFVVTLPDLSNSVLSYQVVLSVVIILSIEPIVFAELESQSTCGTVIVVIDFANPELNSSCIDGVS